MATNNNAKIKKGYVLLFKTPKDEYIKDPYVEVCCISLVNIAHRFTLMYKVMAEAENKRDAM